MNSLGLMAMTALLVVPASAGLLLVVLSGYRLGARLNVGAALVSLLAAVTLFQARPEANLYLRVDDFNIYLIVLNNLVSFTTSVFSASYIAHELETGRLTPAYLRFYHATYQALIFAMNLAFLANNIGLLWVAIELATLITVLMVGIYRTPAALEAAWKYFILGSLGIALALFGTILVYLAAQPTMGEGLPAMAWDRLLAHAKDFDPALLNLAFVFLLLGYGTKAGLVPLHAWLPDAHAEGPTPISAVLSGLLLNVALYAVLRFKMLMNANPAALAPGPLMVILGLLSLLFAGLMLYRRGDIKRLFAYCSGAGQRTRRPGTGQHPADVEPSGAGVRGGNLVAGTAGGLVQERRVAVGVNGPRLANFKHSIQGIMFLVPGASSDDSARTHYRG